MSFVTTRPISITSANTSNIVNKDQSKLIYNLGNIDNYLNVQVYNNNNFDMSGVQFFTSPKNNQVLQYNGYNYIFNSFILTPDIDIIGDDTEVSLGLVIDFLTDSMTNHLYIVLPINDNNSVASNDSNNELITKFTDFITNNGSDIENNVNLTIDDLSSYELNKLIPSGNFYKYYYEDSVKKHTFLIFPPESSKIYSSYTDISYGTTTLTPKTKTTPSVYNPYYSNSIGATQKTIMKDTYEDIYIDCSPVSDASNEIIEQRKNNVFSLRNVLSKTTGVTIEKPSDILIEILSVLCLCIVVYIIIKIGINKMINGIGLMYGIGKSTSNSGVKTGGSYSNAANNKSEQGKSMGKSVMEQGKSMGKSAMDSLVNFIKDNILKFLYYFMPSFCMIVGILTLFGDEVKKVPVLDWFVSITAKAIAYFGGVLFILGARSVFGAKYINDSFWTYVIILIFVVLMTFLFFILYGLIEKFMTLIYNSYEGANISLFDKTVGFLLISISFIKPLSENIITLSNIITRNNSSQTNTNR